MWKTIRLLRSTHISLQCTCFSVEVSYQQLPRLHAPSPASIPLPHLAPCAVFHIVSSVLQENGCIWPSIAWSSGTEPLTTNDGENFPAQTHGPCLPMSALEPCSGDAGHAVQSQGEILVQCCSLGRWSGRSTSVGNPTRAAPQARGALQGKHFHPLLMYKRASEKRTTMAYRVFFMILATICS